MGLDEPFQQFLTHFTNASTTSYIRNEQIHLYPTHDRKLATDNKTLDELEQFIGPSCFFCVNRQSIICLNAIAGYRLYDGGKLLVILKPLFQTQEFIISKEKASAFRHWIDG